jgi:hypothetical protein
MYLLLKPGHKNQPKSKVGRSKAVILLGFTYYGSGNNREIVPGKFMESLWRVPGKFADFC